MSSSDCPCLDCGVETLPVDDNRAEWYMVRNDVWRREAGMTDEPGNMTVFLCVGCLERRLGRRLTAADFIDCPLNDMSVQDTPRYAWSYRTSRLISRLQGAA